MIRVACGLILLAGLALYIVGRGDPSSFVVLPMSDAEGLAITTEDLPGFVVQKATHSFKQGIYGAELNTVLTADTAAAMPESYPFGIKQVVRYGNSASKVQRELDLYRIWKTFELVMLMPSAPTYEDLPIRPGRRETYVKKATSGAIVAYEIDYVLNNVYIDTVLFGTADTLTEDVALKTAEISLKKYDAKVAKRLTFWLVDQGDMDFETFTDLLLRVLVPAIGFVLLLLVYPMDDKARIRLIPADLLGIALATLYAYMLWQSIYISGTSGRIFFIVEGWSGALTVGLTGLVAFMGVSLLRKQWSAQSAPEPLRPAAPPQTSCPRCKQLSASFGKRCLHCGLEFRRSA